MGTFCYNSSILNKLGFGSQDEQLEEIRSRRSHVKDEDLRAWDRKKILLAVLILACLIFALFYFKDSIFPQQNGVSIKSSVDKNLNQNQEVLGATQRVRERIEEIQENVNSLNIVDVATSSPQIQKVINDIKALESLPRDQAKNACEKICSGL